jgi:peptide deformylase
MFDVLIYGDPFLRRRAVPVESFDADLRSFAEELTETMREKDGIGLAATQVGRAIRVAVVDATGGESKPYVLVNPEIIWSSEEREDYEEGCLSIPDIRLKVNRPVSVSVRARDADGTEYTIEKATGLLARALQHEVDHLEGILFVDRVSSLQRQLVAGRLKKLAKESAAAPSSRRDAAGSAL